MPERTITIVDETHREYVRSLPRQGALGDVIYQPMDRGTAVGLLLPLAAVLADSADATVVVTPSDHGVEDEMCFRRGIRRALDRVRDNPSEVVIFGVEPGSVSGDFGWITPSAQGLVTHDGFCPVAGFVEKPSLGDASFLYSAGAVWNTLVLVVRAKTLLDLYRRCLPFHVDVVLTAQKMDPGSRERFLREWYPALPLADFSRDVLMRATNLCLYTWPAEMGWSDLGTPDRMSDWLALQRRPLEISPLNEIEQVV